MSILSYKILNISFLLNDLVLYNRGKKQHTGMVCGSNMSVQEKRLVKEQIPTTEVTGLLPKAT